MFDRLESLADRVRDHRLLLAAWPVGAVALIIAFTKWMPQLGMAPVRALLLSIMWDWWLLCVYGVFSRDWPPTHVRDAYVQRVPTPLRAFLRWYAVFFVFAWFSTAAYFTWLLLSRTLNDMAMPNVA